MNLGELSGLTSLRLSSNKFVGMFLMCIIDYN